MEQRDVELIERLLRTVLAWVNLLRRKNLSIKSQRETIFDRHTEKRKAMSVSRMEEPPEVELATDPANPERQTCEKSQHQRQAAARAQMVRYHSELQSAETSVKIFLAGSNKVESSATSL